MKFTMPEEGNKWGELNFYLVDDSKSSNDTEVKVRGNKRTLNIKDEEFI